MKNDLEQQENSYNHLNEERSNGSREAKLGKALKMTISVIFPKIEKFCENMLENR